MPVFSRPMLESFQSMIPISKIKTRVNKPMLTNKKFQGRSPCWNIFTIQPFFPDLFEGAAGVLSSILFPLGAGGEPLGYQEALLWP
jgi:hypothetical protein